LALLTAGFGASLLVAFFEASADLPRDQEACPYGYKAEVCASDNYPGFEFIPFEGTLLFTGEEPQGERFTIRVEVELEAGPELEEVLDTVETVLGDHRGWTGRGTIMFQHVANEKPDLTILIATPDSVDRLCAPADTEGYFSCRNGERAVLNAERWMEAVPHWDADLAEYRAYLINHEVGHFLGEGHVRCPEGSGPAPVMQQQSIDLLGCEPNGWPHL